MENTTVLDLNQYSYLTFDCYGTLIDWERGILNAMQPILEAHGVAQSDDEMLELFGELEAEAERGEYQSYREVLATVAKGFAARLGFTLSDEERAAFADSVGDWPAFPDSPEALQILARHYKLAILSNIDDALFALSAKRLGVTFNEVVTAQQVGSYKPSLRNFDRLIERLGVPQDTILHVAQSLFHDIEPANAIGLTTVWVNRRHDRPGFGATPPATATPALEEPDLATLAKLVEEPVDARSR
jgi:2-haloacid dehalogenase